MSTNNTSANEGGCQADCSSNSQLPEPSLWNSTLGRRAFLRKTGMATAATAIALHGFRVEVLASESATYQFHQVDRSQYRSVVVTAGNSVDALNAASTALAAKGLTNVTGFPTSPVPCDGPAGTIPNPISEGITTNTDGPTELSPGFWYCSISQTVAYSVIS